MLRLGPQTGAQALLSGGGRRSTGEKLQARAKGVSKEQNWEPPLRSPECSFYRGGRSLPAKRRTLPEAPAGILKTPPLVSDGSPVAEGCTSAGAAYVP